MSIEDTLATRRSQLRKQLNERRVNVENWRKLIVENEKLIEGYEAEIAQIDAFLADLGTTTTTVTLTSSSPITIKEEQP